MNCLRWILKFWRFLTEIGHLLLFIYCQFEALGHSWHLKSITEKSGGLPLLPLHRTTKTTLQQSCFWVCWTLLAVNKNTVICDKNFGTLLYVFHISEIISEIPSTFQNSKETHYKPQKIPFKNAHANLAFFERVIIISGNAPLHPLWCPFPFGLFVRKPGLASR